MSLWRANASHSTRKIDRDISREITTSKKAYSCNINIRKLVVTQIKFILTCRISRKNRSKFFRTNFAIVAPHISTRLTSNFSIHFSSVY